MFECFTLGSLNTNSEIKIPVKEVYRGMFLGSTLVRELGRKVMAVGEFELK